jgi:hypothetical protein
MGFYEIIGVTTLGVTYLTIIKPIAIGDKANLTLPTTAVFIFCKSILVAD